METRLNLINNSDEENFQIVVFQKNKAYPEFTPIAWQVIKDLGPGGRHQFVVPNQFELDCTDNWGNYSERLTVDQRGMQFEMVRTPGGDVVREADPPIYPNVAPSGTRIINRIVREDSDPVPRIQANAYKDGKVVARLTLDPGEEQGFEFEPAIYVGVASEAIEGAPLKAEDAWLLDNKIPVHAIASADLVMTGGGSGPKALPLQFTLEKVVRGR